MSMFRRFASVMVSLLMALVFALAPAGQAAAAIALESEIGMADSKAAGDTLTISVPPAGVAAGQHILIALAFSPANGAVSAADSRGNTYVVDADVTNPTYVRTLILRGYVNTGLSGGDLITVTHPSSGLRAINASAFSGLALSNTLDRVKTGAGNSKAVNTGLSAVTQEYNELLFGVFGVNGSNNDSFTAGAGYTALTNTPGTTGGKPTSNLYVRAEYRAVTTTAAYAANGTLSIKHNWAGALATYRMAPPTVQWSTSSLFVPESAASGTLTATLSAASTLTITADYASLNGIAVAGQDYTAISGALTFPPGAVTQTVSLPILEDLDDETDETLSVNLSNPANAALGTRSSLSVAITDNDPTLISLSSSVYTASESAGSALITATLDAASGYTVTVGYAAASGSAAAGADFSPLSGTLAFAPGQTSATFSVSLIGDAAYEGNETLTLSLSNPAAATLGAPAAAMLTLLDDDPVPAVAFERANYFTREDAGAAVITATLSNPSAFSITVQYSATAGSAVAGSDFTAASGALIFTPGVTRTAFTVPVLEDSQDEMDETVLLALSAPGGASLGAPDTATLTLTDNDGAPTVSLGSDTLAVGESAGPAAAHILLSNPADYAIQVSYATADGSALAGVDYTSASGTLTFTPGQTALTVDIQITPDALDEIDETLTLALSNPISTTLGGPISATLSIQDDDPAPVVSFSSPEYSAAETDPAATITASLSAVSSLTVTVQYATADGSALAGLDYTSTSGALTFAPGQTTAGFSVILSDDVLDESDETIQLSLSSPVNASLGAAAAALLIIDDDPAPSVSLTSPAYSGDEFAGPAVFTITLSAVSGQTVTVNYATAAGAAGPADFTPASGTLSFAPGIITATISIGVTDDALDEDPETFSLALSGPAQASLGAVSSAAFTIVDDDDPPVVQFDAADYASLESIDLAVISVTLSAPSGLTITVSYTSAAGTALAGVDYTAVAGTLTFTPGVETLLIDAPVLDDDLDENDETILLGLSNEVNATPGLNAAALTLLDDDLPPAVSFSQSAYLAPEAGGNAAITVDLDRASGLVVTVQYSTTNGTATSGPFGDYTTANGTLTFAAGVTSASFNVPISQDPTDEPDESVALALLNPANATLGAASAALNIVDDDGTPSLNFSAFTYSAGEASGSAVITASLSNPSASTVTANYATANGTATAGPFGDYTAASGALTFTAGVTNAAFTVSISDDLLDEANETVLLALTSPVNAVSGAASNATLTLVDNDAPPAVSFSSSAYAAGEAAGTAVITANLSAVSGLTVTVAYTASAGTASAADFTPASGQLTFAAGQSQAVFAVVLNDDALDEADETVALSLGGPVNASLGAASATLTIQDDDAPPAVSFSSSAYAVSEAAGTAVITANLSAVSGLAVTVAYTASAGTASAADFTPASGQLTFAPGQSQATFSVAISNDALDEADETVALSLGGPANATLGTASATLAIQDDDLPPTATATSTATGVPPTPTATATATGIPPTPTATATATGIPPTSTATATATGTPPTATATSVQPTATATAIATATGVPPTATGTILAPVDLSLTKTDGQVTTAAGSDITYTLRVTNLSLAAVAGAQLVDNVPAAVTGVAWICGATAGSACGSSSGSGNLLTTTFSLAPGGVATYTVRGALNAIFLGTLTNSAAVALPAGQTDPDTANNTASDATTVLPPLPVTGNPMLYLPFVFR